MTELTRGQKIAAKLKGRVVSEETRRKQSLAHTGVPRSPETCAKIAAAKTGVPRSEETKQKISQGMTDAWANGRTGKKPKP